MKIAIAQLNPIIGDISGNAKLILDAAQKAKKLDADCVEIHTGKLCNLINQKKNYKNELKKIQKAVQKGNELGLEVHAGHGLTYSSAKILSRIKGIEEFNIGHFLIGESIFEGMPSTIRKFKKILKS